MIEFMLLEVSQYICQRRIQEFQSNSMPKYLRSSKKRVELELKGIEKNKKLLPREKAKYLEKLLELSKVIEENQETLSEGIEKLKNLAETEDSEDESAELALSEGSKQGSTGSLAWDNQDSKRI